MIVMIVMIVSRLTLIVTVIIDYQQLGMHSFTDARGLTAHS